jgi:hypothetical protein
MNNDSFFSNGGKEELEPGDLVRVYDAKDAQGHKYYKKLGVILGTIKKPTSFMQFFTYRVLVGNAVAKIHEVWIKKIETKKQKENL